MWSAEQRDYDLEVAVGRSRDDLLADLGPNTLGMGKQIQIRLTPRNLFIQSPGGLRGCP